MKISSFRYSEAYKTEERSFKCPIFVRKKTERYVSRALQ